MQGFLILQLSESSLTYLRTLCAAAPLEFAPKPWIYLTDPRHPLVWADVLPTGLNEIEVSCAVKSLGSIFSPSSDLSEFTVKCDMPLQVAQVFPQFAQFIPYFTWTHSVNRSRSCRSFAISLINTVIMDAPKLSGNVMWEPVGGLIGALFNPHTQEDLGGLSI